MKDNEQIEKLIDGCKQNNQKAQLKIYNLYYKAMFNSAYRIVNDFNDAEDVMQESFIKAFDKIQTYKATSKFGAWLKRIVINESIIWLRKKNKYVSFRNEVSDFDKNPENSEEFELGGLNLQKLLSGLEKLKDNYRLIISLYYLEGYDFEEICEIMHISYANARTMLSRAKSKLRQKLIKENGFVR